MYDPQKGGDYWKWPVKVQNIFVIIMSYFAFLNSCNLLLLYIFLGHFYPWIRIWICHSLIIWDWYWVIGLSGRCVLGWDFLSHSNKSKGHIQLGLARLLWRLLWKCGRKLKQKRFQSFINLYLHFKKGSHTVFGSSLHTLPKHRGTYM